MPWVVTGRRWAGSNMQVISAALEAIIALASLKYSGERSYARSSHPSPAGPLRPCVPAAAVIQ